MTESMSNSFEGLADVSYIIFRQVVLGPEFETHAQHCTSSSIVTGWKAGRNVEYL